MTIFKTILFLAVAATVAPVGGALATFEPAAHSRLIVTGDEWQIPKETIDNAVKRANAASGRNVQHTYRTSDSTKVYITQAIPSDGPGTKLAATKAQLSSIVICPHNIRNAVPAASDPKIMEDVLTIVLLHEFEHLYPADGGDNIPGTNPNGTEPCGHLGEYKRDGERTCAAVKAILDDAALGNEEKCRRVYALCKFLQWLQGHNIPSEVVAAGNCQPPIPTPNGKLVQDCGYCPAPGLECPVHGTTYQSE